MTKSELIEKVAIKLDQLSSKDIKLAVKLILNHIIHALAKGERVEIRGFGSFSLHKRNSRMGRNPKTGAAVRLNTRYITHFKPSKEMRERVDATNTK